MGVFNEYTDETMENGVQKKSMENFGEIAEKNSDHPIETNLYLSQ